jgi:hypothetical protein
VRLRRVLCVVIPILGVSVAWPAPLLAAGHSKHRHRPPVAGPPPSSGCRSGDPLANGWGPSRLVLISPCAAVTGTVTGVSKQGDGDFHVDVQTSSGHIRGEIVPADQPGCTAGQPVRYGVCTGAAIATPPVGSVVTMTGPMVRDDRTGGTEIHPIWQLTFG